MIETNLKISQRFGQFSGFSAQVIVLISLKLVANYFYLYTNLNFLYLPKAFALVSPLLGIALFLLAKRSYRKPISWLRFISTAGLFVPQWCLLILFSFPIGNECGVTVAGDYIVLLLSLPLSLLSSGVFHWIEARFV